MTPTGVERNGECRSPVDAAVPFAPTLWAMATRDRDYPYEIEFYEDPKTGRIPVHEWILQLDPLLRGDAGADEVTAHPKSRALLTNAARFSHLYGVFLKLPKYRLKPST